MSKLGCLKQFMAKEKSAVIAFSGGVDSSLLAKVAYDVLGDSALAITVDSMFVPRKEIKQAKRIARDIGIRHRIIEIPELPADILDNDKLRCYKCKKRIFSLLLEVAAQEGMNVLFDGSNVDDLSDYRPGMKALQELGIKSPLLECGFTKQDIRNTSKQLSLSSWNHPSLACLASRIPYDNRITSSDLSKVEKAEAYLHQLGFNQLRVRCHNNLARIEVSKEERSQFFHVDVMDQINTEFKSLGFKYVSLDLEGYKTGKMN